MFSKLRLGNIINGLANTDPEHNRGGITCLAETRDRLTRDALLFLASNHTSGIPKGLYHLT
jgi:hypothetical protein